MASDVARLETFRCATKRDAKFERLINRALKTELPEVLADPTRDLRAFVAEDDHGTLLGIAAMERSEDNPEQWELMMLGVSVDARRRGIGRALVKFAVANTPESHDEPVVIRVHENNVTMRRLLRTLPAEKASTPDTDGYIVMAADPEVITKDLHVAMARAARPVAQQASGLSLGLDR